MQHRSATPSLVAAGLCLVVSGCQPSMVGDWRSVAIGDEAPLDERVAQVRLSVAQDPAAKDYRFRAFLADRNGQGDFQEARATLADGTGMLRFDKPFLGRRDWYWSVLDGGRKLNLIGSARQSLAFERE